MDDRQLEAWTVGTGTLVLLVVGAVLTGHVTGGLRAALDVVGTASAGFLFGYLWLLVIVAGRFALPSEIRTDDPLNAVGRAAGVGGATALVYLTVVLIIGFVSPTPVPVEQGPAPVFRTVAVVTAIGGVSGPILVSFLVAVHRIGAAI
ncbi:hypothetical protein [Natronomonas amylolytica]|uniref:hypothetical protein n=1 Tax=Natronomonas amylolytica TaxID=3108498 RepID=UPI003008C18D